METWYIFPFLAFLWFLIWSFRHKSRPPPGPWGLPLIGHLHMLGDRPHQSLQKLSDKYGPIMSIRLGLIPTVIISSPEYAELVLKTHDLVFAGRPKIQAFDLMSYGQKNFSLAPYGPYWRNIRKLCSLELLSRSKIDLFRSMRQQEVKTFVQSLRQASKKGCQIDITSKIESLVEDMSYLMIFGTNKLGLKSTIQEAAKITGIFNISDYVPYLKGLDLQGLVPQMKAIAAAIDSLLEEIMEEHERYAHHEERKHKDFIDIMLSLRKSKNARDMQLGREHIKATVIDMLVASVETTSTTIEWVIAELLRHPCSMKLVQAELVTVVGLDRMVEETDLIKLEYLKMVIKESLRIHPVLPFLVPHESMEDITINGYLISKGSKVLINTWAMGRDPYIWSDNAREFYPERFTETDIDIQGHDFRFLPFGSGRRMCPGMQLGLTVVQLVTAQLLHCFNLELPVGMSPEDIDMTEKFGMTLPRAIHIVAVPTYRLTSHS